MLLRPEAWNVLPSVALRGPGLGVRMAEKARRTSQLQDLRAAMAAGAGGVDGQDSETLGTEAHASVGSKRSSIVPGLPPTAAIVTASAWSAASNYSRVLSKP